jgi:cell division protein FtsL
MFAKIKNYFRNFTWQMLRDVRAIGLFMFLIVVLLISWSGVKVIQSNYSLQKQISTLVQENQVQQLKNNNLKLQNDYFNTNQYLELSARQNFGMAAPGETELIVPQSVAFAHIADLPSASPMALSSPSSHEPAYQRNLQAWVNFYLHRQQPSD